MLMEKVNRYRGIIETAMQGVDDETALQAVSLFPEWVPGVAYARGSRVNYGGVLFSVLQDHTSTEEWTPTEAPSLFAKVLIPDPDVIPEWEQPDSTNPYSKGDKVTHAGKTWESDLDGNVWAPGVYGWTEI